MNSRRSWIKTLSTWCVGLLWAFALAAPSALAQNCPSNDPTSWRPSNDGITATINDDGLGTATYIITSSSESAEGGIVPGLIDYCVYLTPGTAAPDSVTAIYQSAGTNGQCAQNVPVGTWNAASGNPFGFGRCDGNPSDLPFGGSQVPVGSAFWSSGVPPPANQIIVLHIFDPDECAALYGSGVSTCWVAPSNGVPDNQNATVLACKFEDQNASGKLDNGEPLLDQWVIDATGVVNQSNQTVVAPASLAGTTGQDPNLPGCVAFTVDASNLDGSVSPITFEEVEQSPDYIETAWYSPDCAFTTSVDADTGSPIVQLTANSTNPLPAGGTCTVYFGNFKVSEGGRLQVTKTAPASIKWDIKKTVDSSKQNIPSGGSATFNYTVAVTHPDLANLNLTGKITISNTKSVDFSGLQVTDSTPGGVCTITDNNITQNPPSGNPLTGVTVPANTNYTLDYTCTFASLPTSTQNNTVALADKAGVVLWQDVESYLFYPQSVTVTDSVVGKLGDVTVAGVVSNLGTNVQYSTSGDTISFTYSNTFTGGSSSDPAGTCTTHPNTATLTSTNPSTNKTDNDGSDSQSVTVCVGADLTARKDATASYTSGITKTAKQSSPVEAGGSTTLNYTVTVTESGWKVAGAIYVTNPNDWEDVTVNLADAVTGATCTVNGGTTSVVVNRSTVDAKYLYSCSFSSAPTSASGTNTATVSWSGAYTPHTSTSPTANYAFASLIVTDTCPGKSATTLGTISTPAASTTYYPSCTVTVPAGSCQKFTNTASDGVDPNATADVTVCNTNTGALTMGFWQGTAGQRTINGTYGAYSGGCPGVISYLKTYAPFAPGLASVSTCAQLNSYIGTTVNTANSSGGGTAMLKGQMLGTALTVYFSGLTPNLVASQGTMNNLGSVKIELNPIKGTENVCPGFGHTGCAAGYGETVSTMLSEASGLWGTYSLCSTSACKANIVLASDAFAYINQSQANIAP